MEVKLKYGTEYKTVVFPEGADVTIMEPGVVKPVADVAAALTEALDTPLNAACFEDMDQPASIAIAVPDETRPTPLKVLLPVLLDRIFSTWSELEPAKVSIVVGGGLHPAPDEAQLSRIMPEDIRGCTVVPHDALSSPMATFGTTSRGTPVEVNKAFGDAELKIVIGQIDPHQFVGFTGGSKGATVGCASKDMIENNHSLMKYPEARVGNVKDNPVRLDLNESGEMIGIQLAINVVLDAAKQVVRLLAGKPADIMFEGCNTTAKVYGIKLEEEFDIVIASCGGTPKDICLYQAQKGLNHASMAASKHGKILLLASCGQGIGDEHYEDYVCQFPCANSQLKEFEEKGFRMGAHKAFLFSRTIIGYDVGVVSELSEEKLASSHLRKVKMQETVDAWLAENPSARIAVVPNANTMYFYR